MTNAPTDLAGEKLSTAKAIADLIAVVNAHEATDSLYRHTLTTAALHIGELIDEIADGLAVHAVPFFSETKRTG